MAKTKKTSASKPPKVPDSALMAEVPGLTAPIPLLLKKLAKGTAGKTGIEYTNLCRTHDLEFYLEKYCPGCGTKDPIKDDSRIHKQPKIAPTLRIKPEEVEERKVKGDGRLKVVQLLEPSEVGFLSPRVELWALTPTAHAVMPASPHEAHVMVWAAFRQMLCTPDGAPARAALVMFVGGSTSSKRTVHGIIYPLPENGLAFEERFRPEDCREPEWPSCDLQPEARQRFSAMGAKHAANKALDMDALNHDPYRQAMEQLFADKLAKREPTPEASQEDADLPATDSLLDLLEEGA